MTGGFRMKDLRVWKKVGRNLLNTTVAFLMLNHYICRYVTIGKIKELQVEMKDLLKQEEESKKDLLNLFRKLGYGIE